MDRKTKIAQGLMGLPGLSLVGVFGKELLQGMKQFITNRSIGSDFSNNRG